MNCGYEYLGGTKYHCVTHDCDNDILPEQWEDDSDISCEGSIENLRNDIDVAVDKWLKANGMSKQKILEQDFSFFDEELNRLLEGK